MKNLSTLLALLFILCCYACEEKPSATKLKAIRDNSKKDSVTISFDGILSGNEDKEKGWVKNINTGSSAASLVDDSELKTTVLHLKCNKYSYHYATKVNIDHKTHGLATWKWKVIKHPRGGDLRKSATDDQAIQVIFIFADDEMINYVWDSSAPVGLTKDASLVFIMIQEVVVVESGDKLNQWFEVKRDIGADYKKIYHKEAPGLQAIAIQTNSQHTGTDCEAYISPIVFKKLEN